MATNALIRQLGQPLHHLKGVLVGLESLVGLLGVVLRTEQIFNSFHSCSLTVTNLVYY